MLFEALNYLWIQGVETTRAHREENGKRKFWASSVGGCLRASCYTQANMPPTHPFGKGLLARMEMGRYIEEQVLGTIAAELERQGAGFLILQVRVENELHMARTDAVMTLTKPLDIGGALFKSDYPIPIEVKSIHPSAIARRKKEVGPVWQPYDSHALQLCQFMALKCEQQEPMPVGALLYISLDGRRRVSAIDLSDWHDELETRWCTLERYLDNGILPDRMEQNKYPCVVSKNPCQFYGYCWGE